MNGAHRNVSVMGLTVFSDALDRIAIRAGSCRTIATISPNSYGIATHDADFRRALREADYLVLDGVYFGLAGLLLRGQVIQAHQGPFVFQHFMRRLQTSGGRALFLGSTDSTLEKITSRAAKDFPNVRVATFSPPFKPEFDADDNRAMVQRINAFNPDVVFLGLTAPKQEKWAHANAHALNAGLVVSIGAVFDWYAGSQPPIHPIWWRLKLVWLVRTIQRPEILRRYPDIMIFFWHLVLAMVGIERYRR